MRTGATVQVFRAATKSAAARKASPAAPTPAASTAAFASLTSRASSARAPSAPSAPTSVALRRASVLAGALAQRRLVAFGVEKVVGDLERRADRPAIGVERRARRRAGARQQGPRLDAEFEERPRFHRLQARDRLDRERRAAVSASMSSIWPPTMPATPAARARPAQSAARIAASRIGPRIGENFEGERLQGVARQNGGRLVEGAVSRRAAAPQIVVVHRRQIVVDQGIGVDALDRRARAGPAPCRSGRARALSRSRGRASAACRRRAWRSASLRSSRRGRAVSPAFGSTARRSSSVRSTAAAVSASLARKACSSMGGPPPQPP